MGADMSTQSEKKQPSSSKKPIVKKQPSSSKKPIVKKLRGGEGFLDTNPDMRIINIDYLFDNTDLEPNFTIILNYGIKYSITLYIEKSENNFYIKKINIMNLLNPFDNMIFLIDYMVTNKTKYNIHIEFKTLKNNISIKINNTEIKTTKNNKNIVKLPESKCAHEYKLCDSKYHGTFKWCIKCKEREYGFPNKLFSKNELNKVEVSCNCIDPNEE